VPGGAINYQENLAPSLLQYPQKPYKAAFGFPLAEREYERPLRPCPHCTD